MNEEERLKIKAFKEKHNVSWAKLIAYTNKLIEKDVEK